MKVRESAQAIHDSEHIATQMLSARAGFVFLQEVQKTYDIIEQTPTIGSVIEELAGSEHEGLRQCTVRRFRNYVIFYKWSEKRL